MEKLILVDGESTSAAAFFRDAQGKLVRAEGFSVLAVCSEGICEQPVALENCPSTAIKVFSKPPSGGLVLIHTGDEPLASISVSIVIEGQTSVFVTDENGAVEYEGVADLVLVDAGETREVFLAPKKVLRFEVPELTTQLVGIQIETDFSATDAQAAGNVQLGTSGEAFQGDISRVSLSSIFGERSERPVAVGATGELEVNLALPESTFLDAGQAATGGLLIVPKRSSPVLIWSLAMSDSFSGFVPNLTPPVPTSDFLLDASGYLNGRFYHAYSMFTATQASSVSAPSDVNLNGINDVPRTATPAGSLVMTPNTFQVRSGQVAHLPVAQGRLLALAAMDVPGIGLIPLGFREFAADEEGTVEFATPHDGFEGFESKIHSFQYDERPWKTESSLKYSNGDEFVDASVVDLAEGAIVAVAIEGNSPSRISLNAYNEQWNVWIPQAGTFLLSDIPDFDSVDTQVMSVTSFLRNYSSSDVQVADGAASDVASFDRAAYFLP